MQFLWRFDIQMHFWNEIANTNGNLTSIGHNIDVRYITIIHTKLIRIYHEILFELFNCIKKKINVKI